MQNKIRDLLYELGIIVSIKKVQESPSCIKIHYELANIKDFAQIAKKLKLVSAFLHQELVVEESEIAHIAVVINKEKTSKISLVDKKYNKCFSGKCSVFAGVDDNNQLQIIDLDEVHHILISGTTGSGKSMMINSAICSLLKQDKYTVEFVMIDTKRVELSPYKKLGKEWCSVATSVLDAVDVLKDACDQLDSRYEIMEKNGWRKIPDYWYRQIIIIEELGDLMLASKGIIEKYIVKIAQLGRACGMHLIIATQRPTVDVVTGSIKANIGCRFALQTTSSIDSRNIIGKNGAEQLRGSGDCLLKLPTKSNEIHIQCPFVSDDDIDRCIKEFMEGK